ncbi:MAG: PorT family protein [Prevotellaceae bacterium]|jgi:hypothetical protein|nr:PorT family protein [Prevotellaceae bacterium]
MKKYLFLLFWLPAVLSAQTTTDTLTVNDRQVIITENSDRIRVKIYQRDANGDMVRNEQVFEGVYLNGQSLEQRFTVSLPFQKRERDAKRRTFRYNAHTAGLYLGTTGLGSSDDVNLEPAKSIEWGLNLFNGSFPFTSHFGVTYGLGFGYTRYRLDSSDGSYGRVRYYHWRLPIALETQFRANRETFFLSAGVEAEYRFWRRSNIVWGADQTTTNKGDVYPFGANLVAKIGMNDIGFYARYAMLDAFKENRGPRTYPLSIGIQWFW